MSLVDSPQRICQRHPDQRYHGSGIGTKGAALIRFTFVLSIYKCGISPPVCVKHNKSMPLYTLPRRMYSCSSTRPWPAPGPPWRLPNRPRSCWTLRSPRSVPRASSRHSRCALSMGRRRPWSARLRFATRRDAVSSASAFIQLDPRAHESNPHLISFVQTSPERESRLRRHRGEGGGEGGETAASSPAASA